MYYSRPDQRRSERRKLRLTEIDHSAHGDTLLCGLMGGRAVRGGGREGADENHDQIGRINRQVMDSCVILVGLSLSLSFFLNLSLSPCRKERTLVLKIHLSCRFPVLCKKTHCHRVILTLWQPQLQLINSRRRQTQWVLTPAKSRAEEAAAAQGCMLTKESENNI